MRSEELAMKQMADDAKKWRDFQAALWEPCDCGCPGKAKPRSRVAVEIIRLLPALEQPHSGDC